MKLYNDDCLKILPKLIKKRITVDCILADLPYGKTNNAYDKEIDSTTIFMLMNKLIKKKGAIILFGIEPFSSKLRLVGKKTYRYDIIWNKVKSSNFQAMNFQPGRIHENISIFSKSPAIFCKGNNMNYYPIKTILNKPKKSSGKFYGKNNILREGSSFISKPKIYLDKHPTSIITFSNAKIKGRYHPFQKPIELLEYLIKTYTKEKEIILDFTMGSGSTGVACRNLNREFIGIEKDPYYFNIASKRIRMCFNKIYYKICLKEIKNERNNN